MKTKPYDPALLIQSDAELAQHLQDSWDSGEPSLFMIALRDAAQIKGMAYIATTTGLSRSTLYRTLNGKRQPRLDTLQKIMQALEVKVSFAA